MRVRRPALVIVGALLAAGASLPAPEAWAQDPGLSAIEREVRELREALDQRPDKDVWDKLSAVSALASGVLVAIIGAIATGVYNSRQRAAQQAESRRELQVMEVQTVASLMPHLQSGEPREKEAALVAISALGNTELMARLATIYGDEASITALSRVAMGGDPEAAKLADRSLEALLRSAVVEVGSSQGIVKATGFAIGPHLVLTADYVGRDLRSPLVRTVSGESSRAEVVAVDEAHGISLLRVPEVRLVRLPLRTDDAESRYSGDVTLLGTTGHGWRTELGRLEGLDTQVLGQLTLLRAELASEPGNGGAPVVDDAGRVVAMLYGAERTGQRRALLLPAAMMRAGLAATGWGFGFTGATSPALEATLETALRDYAAYLDTLGLRWDGPLPEVHVDPSIRHLGSYDATRNQILLSAQATGDVDVACRQYTHRLLWERQAGLGDVLSGQGSVPPAANAIESGLAEYLPCSWRDDPCFGRRLGGRQGGGCLRDLSEWLSFTESADDGTDRYSAGAIWSSLFWALRERIGRERADPLPVQAWTATSPPDDFGRAYARNLLESAPPELRGEIEAIFDDRGVAF